MFSLYTVSKGFLWGKKKTYSLSDSDEEEEDDEEETIAFETILFLPNVSCSASFFLFLEGESLTSFSFFFRPRFFLALPLDLRSSPSPSEPEAELTMSPSRARRAVLAVRQGLEETYDIKLPLYLRLLVISAGMSSMMVAFFMRSLYSSLALANSSSRLLRSSSIFFCRSSCLNLRMTDVQLSM